MTLKDAALRYATLGYPVFPCVPGDKRPATPHGLKDATVDAEQIEKLWEASPNANVAIRTDGLIVVDVDSDGAANPWLENETDKRLELGTAPTAITPRGGRHHYFRQPSGNTYANTAGKIAQGVDTRANGGYVLAPPSIVGGKLYQWTDETLDCEPERLPELPAWLVELLSPQSVRRSEPAAVGNLVGFNLSAPGTANAIPEGQRNAALASLAGTMRRPGMSEAEILAALLKVNAERCRPPLPDDEVRTIARSIASKSPDQVATAIAENHAGQDGLTGGTHEWLTSAEVAARDDRIEYIVADTLPARQGGIIGGRFKVLKTGIGLDLAMSAATGTNFLGRFAVPAAAPSGIMSAESGWPTLKARGIAIAHSKGLELADCSNLYWSTASPKLARQEHLDALRRFIEAKQLKTLFVDPLYLALGSVGGDASNVFSVGEVLSPITRIIEQTGCSIVLLHHARKHRGQFAEQFAPPELSELAFAGFAEWSRFWLLLAQRRNWDEATGRHWLWLQAAGSAGHAGLWHLDVTEGKPSDPGGRGWEVSVIGANEGQRQAEAAKEFLKGQADRQKIDADKQAIVNVVRRLKDFDTQRGIRDRTELRPQRFLAAFNELREQGAFEESFIKKNGHLYDGFKLRPEFSLTIAV